MPARFLDRIASPLLRQALMLAILVAQSSCARSDDVARDVFGSAAHVETVRRATPVEAYRIDATGLEQAWRTATADDYPRLGDAVPVDADVAAELASILTSPRTYDWSIAKACAPTPGVGLRFVHGTQQVDILLCFACDILGVFAGGPRVGGEDFDRARPELVRIVQTLFPDDPVIQALKAER